jgi:hypothetical protein
MVKNRHKIYLELFFKGEAVLEAVELSATLAYSKLIISVLVAATYLQIYFMKTKLAQR